MLYAWYRALARRGAPPQRAANALPSPRFAPPIFGAWGIGVPGLAWGLATASEPVIAISSACLLAGLSLGAIYMGSMLRAARGAGIRNPG